MEKIAPYRTGVKNYVAMDIEGSLGTLNLTIGIYGEILIPSAEDILRAREAVILVPDAFDAFHLVHIIHFVLLGSLPPVSFEAPASFDFPRTMSKWRRSSTMRFTELPFALTSSLPGAKIVK